MYIYIYIYTYHLFLLQAGASLQAKLDESEFRSEIYQKITRKCFQDLSDNFKQNLEVCKVSMSNVSLISLFFNQFFNSRLYIISLTFAGWTHDFAGGS